MQNFENEIKVALENLFLFRNFGYKFKWLYLKKDAHHGKNQRENLFNFHKQKMKKEITTNRD